MPPPYTRGFLDQIAVVYECLYGLLHGSLWENSATARQGQFRHVTLRERICTFSTHSPPTVPHLPATAGDLCTTTLFFDRVCVFSVFGWTVTCAWQSRCTKVFTGGPSVVREGPDPHPARLSYSVGFGSTTTQFFNVLRAPESFQDTGEEVAIRRIEFNRTRDASHV